MENKYVLLKLPFDTVRDLKKLQYQLGKPSLNELLRAMIRMTDNHNANLKCTGWLNTGGVRSG